MGITKLLKGFFKRLYEVAASTNKGIIVILGIRKDVAVLVSKDSMNKSSLKMYFSGFSFSLYYTFQWLLTDAYLEPGRTSTTYNIRHLHIQYTSTVSSC